MFYIPDLRVGKIKDDTLYNLIEKKLREIDINFIDIKKVLKNEDSIKKFLPLGGGHLNRDGYKKIAEIVHKSSK